MLTKLMFKQPNQYINPPINTLRPLNNQSPNQATAPFCFASFAFSFLFGRRISLYFCILIYVGARAIPGVIPATCSALRTYAVLGLEFQRKPDLLYAGRIIKTSQQGTTWSGEVAAYNTIYFTANNVKIGTTPRNTKKRQFSSGAVLFPI